MSHSKARSLPASLLQIVIFISFSNVFVPTEFIPAGQNNNNNNNAQAIELTQEIGRRTTAVTGDPLETIRLFQRLSIAIQQANAVSFASTFKSE